VFGGANVLGGALLTMDVKVLDFCRDQPVVETRAQMKTCFVALVLTVVLTTWSSVASAQKAVFLVRHADRLNESEDSPLSKAGEERAQRLVSLLKDAGITAIYTSPAKSSGLLNKTAEPLALATGWVQPGFLFGTDEDIGERPGIMRNAMMLHYTN
jgi:hypothetical protein